MYYICFHLSVCLSVYLSNDRFRSIYLSCLSIVLINFDQSIFLVYLYANPQSFSELFISRVEQASVDALDQGRCLMLFPEGWSLAFLSLVCCVVSSELRALFVRGLLLSLLLLVFLALSALILYMYVYICVYMYLYMYILERRGARSTAFLIFCLFVSVCFVVWCVCASSTHCFVPCTALLFVVMWLYCAQQSVSPVSCLLYGLSLMLRTACSVCSVMVFLPSQPMTRLFSGVSYTASRLQPLKTGAARCVQEFQQLHPGRRSFCDHFSLFFLLLAFAGFSFHCSQEGLVVARFLFLFAFRVFAFSFSVLLFPASLFVEVVNFLTFFASFLGCFFSRCCLRAFFSMYVLIFSSFPAEH
jgi:hypothetical protein